MPDFPAREQRDGGESNPLSLSAAYFEKQLVNNVCRTAAAFSVPCATMTVTAAVDV